MLHTKFRQYQLTASGEEDFKGFSPYMPVFTIYADMAAVFIIYCPQLVGDTGSIKILNIDPYHEVKIISTHARRVHTP